MKLYLLAPAANADEAGVDARIDECADRIADLIVEHISEDPALFGMRQVAEASAPPLQADTRYGDAETIKIGDRETLRKMLRESGDLNSGEWMLIRSLVTCRAVLFGYDGQALVCLPTSATPIRSPDDTLITVEECSHLLIETDWMDGLLLG